MNPRMPKLFKTQRSFFPGSRKVELRKQWQEFLREYKSLFDACFLFFSSLSFTPKFRRQCVKRMGSAVEGLGGVEDWLGRGAGEMLS